MRDLLIAKHRKQEKETGLNDCKTVEQTREHLIKYADPETGKIGEIGQRDNSFGYGIVSPTKLVFELSENPQPLPLVIPPNWFQNLIKLLFGWFKK